MASVSRTDSPTIWAVFGTLNHSDNRTINGLPRSLAAQKPESTRANHHTIVSFYYPQNKCLTWQNRHFINGTDRSYHSTLSFVYMKNFLSHIRSDLSSGLVVFLIALPLCLGIALASGAPLFSGLIAGIVGGIVVGSLSGSKLSVSGPAAGLTVIVLGAIKSLGSYEGFLLAVVIAGMLQLLFGYIRAGIVSHYFPSAVIKGMLSAIGIILILKQIPHAFGYDAGYEGDFDFFQPDGENTFSEIANATNLFEPGAILIFAVSMAILLVWEVPKLKSQTIFRIIPGGLMVVVAGMLINELFAAASPGLHLKSSHLVFIGEKGGLDAFFGQLAFPDFSFFTNPQVYVVAITIAIVASLETLLCIEAVDKLDPEKNITPTNRELRAQGVGNIVSGLIGGLPLTSVIVRSSANLDAGAKSKMSAIIHGLFLFTSVVFISGLINKIPLASLAAILIVVGYKLAKIDLFRRMYSLGQDQFLPFIVTILAILFTDLLKGIGIGMAVSIFYILKNNYQYPFFYRKEKTPNGDRIRIDLSEEVTFLNKGSILLLLRGVSEGSEVIIDGTGTKNIDHDVKEVIQNFIASSAHKNIKVELKGMEAWKNHLLT